nr:MAG TPA: hypothetical protein [Caudoviricetes sp.]
MGGKGLRFSASGSAGRGCRRCGAERPFLAKLLEKKIF